MIHQWFNRLPVGTKSILIGAHAFWFHPFFVARAWYHLYGFPYDPRLWVAFFVHDLGYLGKVNMDGPEGESHLEFGAKIMHFLFDWSSYIVRFDWPAHGWSGRWVKTSKWYEFCLYHSRYYTKKTAGAMPSRLCFADKLSFCYTPRGPYLWMTKFTGELTEYLENAKKSDSPNWGPCGDDPIAWHIQLREYMAKWVEAHKDGAKDTWTNGDRNSAKIAA